MIRNLPNAAGYTDSQGHVRAAQGGDALHPAKGHRGRHARRRLPRQRRLRADRDGHATRCSTTATKCWCRRPTIRCGPRRVSLSGGTPVHYICDEADRLDARPRRHPPQDHAATRRASSSSTRTTRPARCIRTSCCSEIVELARQHQLIDLRRRDLRQDAVRRREAHAHRLAGRRRAVRSPSTACRRTTAPAATAPAGWWSRATRSATPRTTSRA